MLRSVRCGALRLDALGEFPGHLEMDVGREERRADLGQGGGHVLLGKLADSAEVPEGGREFVGQGFKHGNSPDASMVAWMQSRVLFLGWLIGPRSCDARTPYEPCTEAPHRRR